MSTSPRSARPPNPCWRTTRSAPTSLPCTVAYATSPETTAMSEHTAISPSPSGAQRVLDLLSGAVTAIAATALIGLVVVQGWQVIARYVLNDSPSWTEPVTLVLLSTAMGLAAAAGVHTNRHFGFFLLAEALGPRSK